MGGATTCPAQANRATVVGAMAVLGVTGVTAFSLVLIYAFRYASVAVGTLLLYLAPALVTGSAAIWRTDYPLTQVHAAAQALSFLGVSW